MKLPCKELENLLLDGSVLKARIEIVAMRRSEAKGEDIATPSIHQIDEKIDAFSLEEEVKNPVWCHWLANRLSQRIPSNPSIIAEAEKEFSVCWHDPKWRRLHGSGKAILTSVRKWLQAEFLLTLGATEKLFAHLTPSPELRALFDQVANYIESVPAAPK